MAFAMEKPIINKCWYNAPDVVINCMIFHMKETFMYDCFVSEPFHTLFFECIGAFDQDNVIFMQFYFSVALDWLF